MRLNTHRIDRILIRHLLAASFALGLVLALAAPPSPAPVGADEQQQTYPVMQPDDATFRKWMRSYDSAPTVAAPLEAQMAGAPGGSVDLLSHLSYVPSERSQGSCGNCWAWAGTGCLEIAMDVQTGIYDRLSVQYINSCQTPITGNPCCDGGWLAYDFVGFYDATGICVPWLNTNANWQDRDTGCDVLCGSIATEPYYEILDIGAVTVKTHAGEGVSSDEAASANIKSVLDSGRAVWFAFFVPSTSAWSRFTSFWLSSGEESVCDLEAICSGSTRWGGHAVLCVGYNDSDPDDSYWVMLNSWGTANGGRPNGLFRVDMDMDYDTTCGSANAFYWQTLDVSFGVYPEIGVSPSSLSCSVLQNRTEQMSFTIGNTGDADLTFTVADTESDTPTPGDADCSWLTEAPDSGALAVGDDEDITVTVDANGLAAGDREATILVCSNDPAASTVTLPVTVTVLPAADLVPTILCAEWKDGGTDSYTVTLAVTNEGGGVAEASTARLLIDDSEVAAYNVPSLGPDEAYTNTYGPVMLSDGQDELSLLVDTEDEVSPEVSEGNNGLVQFVDEPATGQVELRLMPGWNMVSVPLVLVDSATDAVFPTAAAVYTWDPVSKSYVMPSAIEPDRAYWVAVVEETTVPLEGLTLTEYVADLVPGWHMLGSVYGATAMFEDPHDAPAGSVDGFAYHWNPLSKAYDYCTALEAGAGYWVAASLDSLLEVS